MHSIHLLHIKLDRARITRPQQRLCCCIQLAISPFHSPLHLQFLYLEASGLSCNSAVCNPTVYIMAQCIRTYIIHNPARQRPREQPLACASVHSHSLSLRREMLFATIVKCGFTTRDERALEIEMRKSVAVQ